jgi:hypothetical protein
MNADGRIAAPMCRLAGRGTRDLSPTQPAQSRRSAAYLKHPEPSEEPMSRRCWLCLTPQSSKITVEIEVRPHVTVETDLSQTAGTGIGLNYKYDY